MGRLALWAASINQKRRKIAPVASGTYSRRVYATPVSVRVPVAVGTVGGLPWYGMATATGRPEAPANEAEAKQVLKGFGFKGLAIDAVEPSSYGSEFGRVWALTGPVLQESGEMKRLAVTIVLFTEGDDIRARRYEGWIVGDLTDQKHS